MIIRNLTTFLNFWLILANLWKNVNHFCLHDDQNVDDDDRDDLIELIDVNQKDVGEDGSF